MPHSKISRSALCLCVSIFTAEVASLSGCAGAPEMSEERQETRLTPEIVAAVAAVSSTHIESRIRALAGFGTRHTLSETESETRGVGAARRWIERELRRCSADAGGRLRVSVDEHLSPAGARLPRAAQVVNVVATLPGDDPQARERILVVSGHYDSRVTDVMNATADAPGADDDASGVAAVMEMACVMAGHHYGATLVFMAVAGEEQGLLGSEHWAEQARSSGVDVEAMITNDIIGSPVGDLGQRDAYQVRLFADGLMPLLQLALGQPRPDGVPDPGAAGAPALRAQILTQVRAGGAADFPANQLGRHIKEAGERYVPGFKVNLIQRPDRFLRGGDHLPFLARGYAAVRMTEPFENFDHQHQDVRSDLGRQYGDNLEFVDPSYVADVTRVNLAALATLALAPRPPQNVRVETLGLGNDTKLRWQASTETNLTGYRVVWRETGSPVWQHGRDVGKVDVVSIPVSKDNVIFGVQAIGSAGTGHNASLASFPLPLSR